MQPARLELSGERFSCVYHLTGCADDAAARARALAVCVEQTVEFPADLLPPGDIPDQVVGRVASLRRIDEERYEAVVDYAVETVGDELTQLLNVAFGNISIQPGIRLVRLQLPEALLRGFRGPRFGRAGLRKVLNAPKRALLCTAVKPMGLSPDALADLAYRFALGGIDLVKDDHGLADQPFCRFEERVSQTAAAVERANRESGSCCLYVPNVTAPADRIAARARFAKEAGAGGLLISPGLVGLDAMRRLADDDTIGLPIFSHPALQGSFVVDPRHGVSHGTLFGQIHRLAGADACIFPNHGGRFSFSPEECRDLVEGTVLPMHHVAPIFPMPGGGMSLSRVPEMLSFYGLDVTLLIGGDLHRHGRSLTEACRMFRRLIET